MQPSFHSGHDTYFTVFSLPCQNRKRTIKIQSNQPTCPPKKMPTTSLSPDKNKDRTAPKATFELVL